MGPTFSVEMSTLPENEAFSPSCIPFTKAVLPVRDASKGSSSKTRLSGAGSAAELNGAREPIAASSNRTSPIFVAFRIGWRCELLPKIIGAGANELLEGGKIGSRKIARLRGLVTRSNCRHRNNWIFYE